jgi:outer membrane protein TolC
MLTFIICKWIKIISKQGIKIMKRLIFLFLLLPAFLYSQESIEFNLDDCIKYAIRNSPAAKSAKASYKARSSRINAFNAGYLPQLNLTASLPGLEQEIVPVTQGVGSDEFQYRSQYYSSGGLTLTQKIAPLGSQFTVFSGLSRIDLFSTGNNRSTWLANPVSISYNQPIFTYNAMKWEIKVQDIREQMNDNEYSTAIENISMSTAQIFFDLYIAKMNLRNAEQNIGVNDTLNTISKGRFEVGRIAENDLLQSELAYLNAKNAYERALLDYRQVMEEFSVTLGISGNSQIQVNPPLIVPTLEIDEEFAVRQAMENNPDIKNIEIDNLRAAINLKASESNNGINANLIASYGLNNSADLLPDAYRDLSTNQRLNLTLQVPVFQWGRGSSEIEAALEDKNRTEINNELQKKNLEIEVRYQALRLNQLIRQVEISAKADTIAARRFEVAINRYYVGKIDLNSFFIAQNEKDSAFQSYIQMLKTFWTSYYNLRRQTLYDFISDKKIVHLLDN